jgi:uncharacterized protein
MPTADLSDARLAALVSLASAAPGQTLGRTAAVKLLYFLQELYRVPLGYDFRLYTFGPYDAEILNDLGTAKTLDALTEKTVFYNIGYGYEISPGPQAEAVQARARAWLRANRPKIDAVAAEFGRWSASDLELGATVVFADREFAATGRVATEAELASRVREIKPHFSEATVLARVNDFRDKGWLRSVA